jgi:hypothetical protein
MFKKLNYNQKLLTSFAIIISIVFIGRSFYNSLAGGSDFETSYILAKSFWNGIDVFTLESKNPFYPHFWYLILYPFVNLEFKTVKIIFFALNLIFFYGSIFLLKINFKLNPNQVKILIILSVASTPFTNLIGIGNLSLFSLFFILIFYFYNSIFLKGLALSLAITKYNMAFLFFIYAILSKQYKVICIFFTINILSILFYFYYLDISDFHKVFGPLISLFNTINHQIAVGEIGINIGVFNVHNFLISIKLANLYYYLFILFIFTVIYLVKFSINSKEKIFIFLLFNTAVLIYHTIYDYVLLIPILAYILKNKSILKFFYLYLFSIFYVFYIFKINIILDSPIPKEIFSTVGMVLLFFSNYLITFKEKI